MVHVTRSEREAARLTDDLAGAVEELRSCLEPTPGQLTESYRRVRKVLSSLPGVAGSFERASSNDAAGALLKHVRGKRLALRRRCARWLASSAAVASLGVAAALGRWTASEGRTDTRLDATAARAAASPATSSAAAAGPSAVAEGDERGGASAGVSPIDVPVAPQPASLPIPPPAAPSGRARSVPRGCSLERDALLRAECQLRSGQPGAALDSLRHASADAPPELVSAIELLASCQLGRDVRALAARFLEAWPSSPLRERIRNECPDAVPVRRRVVAGAAPRRRGVHVE